MRSLISVRRRLNAVSAPALLLAAVLASDARAQAPEEAAPEAPPAEAAKPVEEDLSRPMGPPDPFNRGTPRGSMYTS